MESPRIAVRVEGSTVVAPVKTACVSVDWAVKVPRRRKIAEGLSLESLRACASVRVPGMEKRTMRDGGYPHS